MPLPPSGKKTVWPPPQFDAPFADMDVWHAWYSGDTDHLAAVYGGAGGAAGHHLGREFFDLNRSAQYRGGIVGGLARMWWGQPITPGQPAAKLHVPLAADIAEMSASLLFSDVPTVVADSDSTSDSTATTDQLKRYLDDRGHATLRRAAEIAAALGGAYVRVTWDREVADRPFLDVIYPDAAVPEWSWGRLRAVTLWRELSPLDDPNVVWRLLERHERGQIEYGLYRGDVDTLGILMALDDHPESAPLATRVTDGAVQKTGVDRLLVSYVPNFLPNRLWREPDTEPLGRSDYSGIEPMLDSLDEAWTSWMRDLRLGKGRVAVPQSMLETDGPGTGGMLDLDREVFVQLNMLDTGLGAEAIKAIQFAIRVEEHERTTAALRKQILSSAGYSAQSFGDEGSVAVTATEVAARKEHSLSTRGEKILYWRPELVEVLTTMLAVDRAHFRANVDPGAELTASWPQAVQPDQEATARTLSLLDSAGAISTWMKVKMRSPEWDDIQVAEEVLRIRQDKQSALPAGDPYNTHGQGEPDEDEPDEDEELSDKPDGGQDEEEEGGGEPAAA